MTRRIFALVLALAGAVAACDSNTVSAPDAHDEIVGSWVSTGADIAPAMVSMLKPRRVEATFDANRTYAVIVTDSADAIVVFTGTWTASGTPGSLRAIRMQQTSLGGVVTSGIFQVTDSTLVLEVIQGRALPAGYVPPTIAGGFGSTARDGAALGEVWTQKFTRQAPQTASDSCNPDEATVTAKRPCVPAWNGTVPKGWQ